MYTLNQLIGWTFTGVLFGMIFGIIILSLLTIGRDNAEQKESDDTERRKPEEAIIKDFYTNNN